jgi:hypothetical protein
MAPMNESRKGNGEIALAVTSPQMAAARVSKFNTRYIRDKLIANRLILL